MTAERTVLLVVHTGRDEATETARRVEKVLGDKGLALRVLSAEAVDRGPLHLAPDDMRVLGVDIEVVDADSNAARSELLSADSSRNYIDCGHKLVALLGVKDLIIVDTPDALLVADRSRAQQVGEIVKLLEKNGREELL